MAEIFLVRHGQASFGAENYDKLSDLGFKQAVLLGEYWKQRSVEFDGIFMGDMVRHRETAEGILQGLNVTQNITIHSGLNEFDFANVAEVFLQQNPDCMVPEGAPRSAFYRLLKQAMTAWSQDALPEAELAELWHSFQTRVLDALAAMRATGGKRILVVSSGGAIASLVGHVMQTGPSGVINLNLQTRNASVSQILVGSQSSSLSAFNLVPHLDVPGQPELITYS